MTNRVEQVLWFMVASKALPELITQPHRTVYRFNAKQVDGTQDEREDSRVQVRTASIPICCNRATIFSGSDKICECRTTNRVQATSPAFFFERARAFCGGLITAQNLACP